MKSKRAKPKPVIPIPKPQFEQCWYCELNADAGAEAAIVLIKHDDEFQYFDSEPEENKQIVTQVEIPRCVECKTAHDKVEAPIWLIMLLCFAAVALAGVYLGIFIESLPWWTYLMIGLAVSGAVVGIAVGASRNLFLLPKSIKKLHDIRNQKEVEALLLKGWKINL